MAKTGVVRVGISGWTYKPWRGVFFPPKLPHKRELEFASGTFRTIEINGTFYSLQRPSSYQSWAERTPDDFVFSVKASRYITHLRRLRNVETPLANFFASGMLKLGAKLGPILWQFPPNFRYDPDLLEEFFRPAAPGHIRRRRTGLQARPAPQGPNVFPGRRKPPDPPRHGDSARLVRDTEIHNPAPQI